MLRSQSFRRILSVTRVRPFVSVVVVALAASVVSGFPERTARVAHAVATQRTFLPSTLVFTHSGKCLDVSLSVDGNANGADVQQWDCLGAKNQTWTITPAGTFYGTRVYTVRAAHSGKCLDVAGYATSDGSRVQQWDCHGGNNQLFVPVRVNGNEPAGVHELQALQSGKCLDVPASGQANGAGITIYTCTGTSNQRLRMRAYAAAGDAPGFRFKTFPISDQAELKVNVASGNLMYRQGDLAAPGIGAPLELVRYYNSMPEPLGPNRASHLGNDWQLNLGGDVYLDQVAEGGRTSARVRMPSGYTAFFADTGSTILTSPPGMRGVELSKTATGHATRRPDSGHVTQFGQAGLLTSVADRFGNKISVTYAANNQTSSIADSLGRLVTFTYNSTNYASGKVTAIKDWTGRELVYGYDTAGNLRTATDLTGKTISYDYDANGRLVKVTDGRGYATSITYDAQGRVYQVHQPTHTYPSTFYYNRGRTACTFAGTNFQAPEPALPASVIDATGVTAPDVAVMARYCFDTEGRVVRTIGRNGDVTQQTFGADSEKTELGWGDGATVNKFDGLKRVTSRTAPTGANVKYAYGDPAHPYLPTSYTDQQGNTSTMTYTNARLTRSADAFGIGRSFTYNTNGNIATSTDRKGNQTTYSYNTSGQLTSITRPLLGATTMTYDAVGRVASVTDGKGQKTVLTYDNLNRPVRLLYADGTAVAFEYDPNGNVVKRQQLNSSAVVTSTSSYTFDALSRLKTETLPGGKVHTYTYNDRGYLSSFGDGAQKTTYLRTEAGDIYKVIDPEGKETFIGWAWAAGEGEGMAPSQVPTFSSQPVEVQYPNGLSVYQAMDKANRVIRTALFKTADNQVLHDVSKALLDYRYSYTRSDGVDTPLLHKVTDAKTGMVTYYDYDARNRLRARTVDNADGSVRSNLVFNYDATGNRTVDYNTVVAAHSGKCLDVHLGDDRQAAVIEQMWCSTSPAQNFSLQPVPGGYYRLMNGKSGKCVDVKESSTADGATVYQWRCHRGANQQFRMTFQTGGNVSLVARHSGKCLDIEGVSSADAARVQQWTCNNGLNQQFALKPVPVARTYNTANQLTAEGNDTFGYDPNGNLTSGPRLTSNSPYFSATYNAKNQTTSMTGMGTAEYAGPGQSELTKAGVTGYENSALGITRIGADSYTRAPGGALVSMNTAIAGKHYYVRDPLGNVLATVDAGGNISSTYDYTPHGASTSSGAVASPFRFQGELLVNPSHQTYKIGERFYDAARGRWTQADLMETENRYLYSGGDPVNNNDPSGLMTMAECIEAAVAQFRYEAAQRGGMQKSRVLRILFHQFVMKGLCSDDDPGASGAKVDFWKSPVGPDTGGTVALDLEKAMKDHYDPGGTQSPATPPGTTGMTNFQQLRAPGSAPSQPDVETGISAAALALGIAGTLVGHCT